MATTSKMIALDAMIPAAATSPEILEVMLADSLAAGANFAAGNAM